MEAIQNLLVALGISETQIKALTDETTPEQINEIADEFHKNPNLYICTDYPWDVLGMIEVG